MRILYLSGWFPVPADNGSKLRLYNLLRGLASHHEISLIAFADQPGPDANPPELRSLCRELQVVPWKPFNPGSARSLLGLLSPTPRSLVDTFSPEMAQRIAGALNRRSYDLAIAFEWGMASYNRYFSGLPALLENAEAGLLYQQFADADSPWRRLRNGLTWVKHRVYLSRLLRHFRACTVASEQERQLFSQIAPGYQAIEVIPNCVNTADYETRRGSPRPDSLIFTGSFRYSANYDAMCWFLKSIYPGIRIQVPAAELTITGDPAGQRLPQAEGVTLAGYVDDVRPLVASSSISVVPIRQGGGTRLKILEAMALGTPVVATSKAAEGLDVEDGRHLLIADTADAFAEAVVSLLKDTALRSKLAGEAHRLVRSRYDWGYVLPRYLDLVERVARGR